MELLESKSLLAKLMATENLVVEQRPVQTASFDVKNRILTLPILDKKLSGFMYDLFTGHEVGHALYTPIEGMMKAREEKVIRDVLNVVEDSRIERKIKYKYPGLKNSFVKAYTELMERDFFGIDGKDINTMNFLDRINLHCKGGAALNIKFNDKERALLDEVESTETYDDVIDVSKKIIEYMKEQIQQDQENRKKDKPKKSDDSAGDDEYEYEEVDFDDEGQPDSQSGSSDAEEEVDVDAEDDKQSDGEPESFEGADSNIEDQIRSFTDEAYKENERKLFDSSISNVLYVNVPNLNPNQVNDHKTIWKRYKEDNLKASPEIFLKIRNESNKVVSYLVKEFELRKNADQLKRATISKTGDLNMSKIYSYGFSEDIFKKISVVPGGKSHGLVMYLDWSGSMVEHIGNTMKQLINLVLFCKKLNIPYEVYAFAEDTDSQMVHTRQDKKEKDMYLKPYALMNLLSSRMSSSEFTYACSCLVYMAGLDGRGYFPYWMSMQGTPLNQSIVHAMSIVPEFQKKNKLQIVNTIFLTDGESTNTSRYYEKDSYYGLTETSMRCDRLIIRDPITKYEVTVDNNRIDAQTDALIRLLKNRTHSNVIGFYVIGGRDFNRKVYQWFPKNHDSLKEEFRRTKFMILENTGYDEYYILKSSSLDTDEDSTFEVKEGATFRGIASAFTKYNSGKHNSRVVLNRFIKLIA